MNDQLLPDFDGPVIPSAQPEPRKPRPRPQRKRPAKKAAKRTKRERAMVAATKRVPKKRRTRKPIQYGTAEQKVAAGRAFAEEQNNDFTFGHLSDLWNALEIFKKYNPDMRKRLLEKLAKALS